MSSEPATGTPLEADELDGSEELAEIEVLDAVPVSASGGHGPAVRALALTPAVQTAAAAATGVVVGAAALALLRRRELRRISRDFADLRERSYLVHVRLLSRPHTSSPG